MKRFLLTLLIITCAIATQAQKNLTLLGSVSFPGQSLAGCWRYVDNTGHNYALVGVSNALAIVDIQNPAAPVVLQSIPGVSSIWREVKVYSHYAYATTEGTGPVGEQGVLIVDLSSLPGTCAYKYYNGDGAIAGQLITAHTVQATDGYLYINGSNIANGGVVICDLNIDPWNPTFVGMYDDFYCHDSYVYNDTLWASEILAGKFSIIDITNKSNPVFINDQITPGQFNHNGWLSDNKQVFFTTDEINGEPLASYDVSNVNNIQLLDEYLTDTFPNDEVHNVRVLNDYLICPSYGSQITIVDAARPDNLIETANYPTGNFLCWDADPYLPNGNIIASDMYSSTLYIFSPTYVRGCYLEGNVTDSLTNFPINGSTIEILLTPKTENSNLLGNYKTGTADAGTYTIRCSQPGYYTQTVAGVQLQNGVLTTLDFKLVPIGFGIEEPEQGVVQVYPNPFNSQTQITLNKNINQAQIITNIYDVAGRLVRTQMFNKLSAPSVIKRGNLSSGAYTMEVVAGEKVIAREKLIVE